MLGGIQAGQRCRLFVPNRPCPISLIDVGNFVPLIQVCASFSSNMDCEYLRCWRCTTDAWPGKVAPVQRRLTLPFVDRFPAWLQKSSPGSGSWELDYAFRSLSRILFIFRRMMFDDAYRREYSDQSKAILWALEFTIESAHPPSLCSRSKISSPWSLFC